MLDAALLKPISFDPEAGTNVAEDTLRAQVEMNIRRGLPQAQPYTANPEVALLVCGGPSLNETLPELLEAHWAGGKVITVNGSYGWCIDRNIKPSATVVMDGREFNSRFVDRPVPGCKYLLASQAHPRAFEVCKGRDVTIWHTCSGGEDEHEMLKAFYFDRVFPIGTGTTVAIKAIQLLRMLGFLRIHIFGLDSCWLGDEHHAYSQAENSVDQRIQIWLRPAKGDEHRDDLAKEFVCAPWHVRQAQDFIQLTKENGNLLQLEVHGPGLIATMVRTGAQLAPPVMGTN
jgi:6-hydroxymethylpterin diphosphokinase MptE-like